MIEYPKIYNVFKRDPATGRLIMWDWAKPEFEYLQYNEWLFTEKVDGMNIRVMWDGESVKFAGRTDRAQLPPRLLGWLAAKFPSEKFAGFDGETCLYGEGYGAGIQKAGKLYLPTQEFVLFDVKIGQWWLTRSSVEDVAKQLEIDVVPLYGGTVGCLRVGIDLVTDGLKSFWGDFEPEGIVARPFHDLFTRSGDRVICKIKANDFRY